MPPVSLGSARFVPWIIALGAALVGCFDVEQVDVEGSLAEPTPRLIDDFDDDFDNSERQPSDVSFEPWRCFGTGGAVQAVRCDAGPGADGQGRVLTFDLFDLPNGQRDYKGAELQTRAREAVDFSAYERFVFSAALSAGATPSEIPVVIIFYCDGVAEGGFLQSPGSQALPSSAAFRPCPMLISTFHQPDWQKEQWNEEQRTPLDERACLANVSALGITVQPDMPDGREAVGKMSVDEIYAQ